MFQSRNGAWNMRIILALAALCLGVMPALAGADRDAEREHLARLAHELAALAPLLAAAERHADPDARIRFRHDWLRQDLERVHQGIQEHLQAPRAEPRRVEPLRGDYRR
jgi:RAQPRD family integrative conjugative element protein